MKIRSHPRMHNIAIGDEVYSHATQLYANVAETFPAAVCVRVGTLLARRSLELVVMPQLWRADDIENLSVCRHCGSRANLHTEHDTGVPFRVCDDCASKLPVENRRPPADERERER